MSVEFRVERSIVEILDPGHGFRPRRSEVEVRWDPLTGHTSRLIPPSQLIPPGTIDLAQLARETEPSCPFCAGRVERLTPRLPPDICPEGRIRSGEALLFPNLLPYARYASVSVYSPARHLLPLQDMTARLVTDNLRAQVAWGRAVVARDPEASWASVNANFMPPSGSSLFHPHLQGNLHPVPTTVQRALVATPGDLVDDYLTAERREGRRWLGETGSVSWVAGFAPMGPAEIRAFVAGAASPVELSADQVDELGGGLATALRLYAELGFVSFNLALYGAPPGTPGYRLNLRLVARSNPAALYRSDVTYLERLHWEAAVDLAPEALAALAGRRFAP